MLNLFQHLLQKHNTFHFPFSHKFIKGHKEKRLFFLLKF